MNTLIFFKKNGSVGPDCTKKLNLLLYNILHCVCTYITHSLMSDIEERARHLLPSELVDHINDFRPICRKCGDSKTVFAPGDTICVKCAECYGCGKQNIELVQHTEFGDILWVCKGKPCNDLYRWYVLFKSKLFRSIIILDDVVLGSTGDNHVSLRNSRRRGFFYEGTRELDRTFDSRP